MANSVNWQELQALAAGAGFSNMPIGKHEAEITKAEYAKTSSTDKDMYKVIFKAVSGPDAGSTHPNNFVLSPDSPVAMGFFFRHMAALGLDAAYFATNPGKEQLARDLVGRRAQIVIREQRSDPSRTEVGNVLKSLAEGETGVVRSTGADPLDIFAQPAAADAPTDTPPPLPF